MVKAVRSKDLVILFSDIEGFLGINKYIGACQAEVSGESLLVFSFQCSGGSWREGIRERNRNQWAGEVGEKRELTTKNA